MSVTLRGGSNAAVPSAAKCNLITGANNRSGKEATRQPDVLDSTPPPSLKRKLSTTNVNVPWNADQEKDGRLAVKRVRSTPSTPPIMRRLSEHGRRLKVAHWRNELTDCDYVMRSYSPGLDERVRLGQILIKNLNPFFV